MPGLQFRKYDVALAQHCQTVCCRVGVTEKMGAPHCSPSQAKSRPEVSENAMPNSGPGGDHQIVTISVPANHILTAGLTLICTLTGRSDAAG